MSIQAMKHVVELYDEYCYNNDYGGIEFNERHAYKFIEAIEALRTAIQQAAESEPVGEPRARVELIKTGGNAGLSTRIIEMDIATRERLRPGDLLYTHPAPGVSDGWRIEEKGGDIIVRKDGFGGYSARKNTESIAEAVLHELALDLLTASPAQKG